MKRLPMALVATLAFMLFTGAAVAQEKERPKDRPGEKRKRPGGDRGFRPPPNPLIEALDANKDGEISAEEISNAAVALKKLDKDGDGKLTREELRPPRPGGRNARGRFDLFQYDKNKDGKLTKDELPERASRFIEFADANKDGAVTKEELEKSRERFREKSRKKRPGGEGDRKRKRPQRPEGAEPKEADN